MNRNLTGRNADWKIDIFISSNESIGLDRKIKRDNQKGIINKVRMSGDKTYSK